MEPYWIPFLIQTAAVLIWCSRGFWRRYPAWTSYGVAGSLQGLATTLAGTNSQQAAGIWAVAAPLMLLGLIDSVLEIFLRLSELYRRFHRDRWKWLMFPVAAGLVGGLALIYPRLGFQSDYYRAMFLANTVVGTVCVFVLLLGWIASIPVRIPINLRKHLMLLAIYVGSTTLAYANYFTKASQSAIRDLLLFMPPMVMLAWSLLLDPQEELEPEKSEDEMPESTLDQILGLLKRLS